jgi:hypothetical protein
MPYGRCKIWDKWRKKPKEGECGVGEDVFPVFSFTLLIGLEGESREVLERKLDEAPKSCLGISVLEARRYMVDEP